MEDGGTKTSCRIQIDHPVLARVVGHIDAGIQVIVCKGKWVRSGGAGIGTGTKWQGMTTEVSFGWIVGRIAVNAIVAKPALVFLIP